MRGSIVTMAQNMIRDVSDSLNSFEHDWVSKRGPDMDGMLTCASAPGTAHSATQHAARPP
jgi:hypothetical protein